MILAEENSAVPFKCHHLRNSSSNSDLVEEQREARQTRMLELADEEMDGGRRGGDGEGVDDEFGAMELGFPIRQPMQRPSVVVVGYALTMKKVKSFLQLKLECLARTKGIMFVPIDHDKPLSDQGPLDIALHKLSGKGWRQIIEDYRQIHPEVTVLDPPDAIQNLRNRQYMLQEVAWHLEMKIFSLISRCY